MDASLFNGQPFELKTDCLVTRTRPPRYPNSEFLMSRRFLVQIDIERLRSHLSKADREQKSVEQVVEFLADAGFHWTSNGWLVSEEDLGVLDPDEVTAVEELPGEGP